MVYRGRGMVFQSCHGKPPRLKRIGNKLYINPELPEGINGYEAKLKICGTQINLTVKKASFSKLIVDGEPAEYIPLDRNTHKSDYFSEYLLS